MKLSIKPKIVIGIDPDVTASGVGIIDITEDAVTTDITSTPLPTLITTLIEHHRRATERATPFRLYIEAGWFNKGDWHLNPRDNKQLAAAKGRQVGRNHQLGLDICSLLDFHNIPHTEVAPLIKCWKGRDRKITHEELDSVVRNINGQGLTKKRSNQEERDALLLALVRGGFPIICR